MWVTISGLHWDKLHLHNIPLLLARYLQPNMYFHFVAPIFGLCMYAPICKSQEWWKQKILWYKVSRKIKVQSSSELQPTRVPDHLVGIPREKRDQPTQDPKRPFRCLDGKRGPTCFWSPKMILGVFLKYSFSEKGFSKCVISKSKRLHFYLSWTFEHLH